MRYRYLIVEAGAVRTCYACRKETASWVSQAPDPDAGNWNIPSGPAVTVWLSVGIPTRTAVTIAEPRDLRFVASAVVPCTIPVEAAIPVSAGCWANNNIGKSARQTEESVSVAGAAFQKAYQKYVSQQDMD